MFQKRRVGFQHPQDQDMPYTSLANISVLGPQRLIVSVADGWLNAGKPEAENSPSRPQNMPVSRKYVSDHHFPVPFISVVRISSSRPVLGFHLKGSGKDRVCLGDIQRFQPSQDPNTMALPECLTFCSRLCSTIKSSCIVLITNSVLVRMNHFPEITKHA
jgi:hypothetical protein